MGSNAQTAVGLVLHRVVEHKSDCFDDITVATLEHILGTIGRQGVTVDKGQ